MKTKFICFLLLFALGFMVPSVEAAPKKKRKKKDKPPKPPSPALVAARAKTAREAEIRACIQDYTNDAPPPPPPEWMLTP
jgi:hypothetical protein